MTNRELDIVLETKLFGDSFYLAPMFSTDIAACWEIVRYLNSKGWKLSLCSSGNKSTAKFYKNGLIYKKSAKTPQKAICLAALELVK